MSADRIAAIALVWGSLSILVGFPLAAAIKATRGQS